MTHGFVRYVAAALMVALSPAASMSQEDAQNSPAFTRKGIMNIRAGNIPEGLKHLDKAIDLDPENSLAYFWRGKARVSMGNYADSVQDFSKVIELDPTDPTAYIERANARKIMNDDAGARADMDQAVKLQPSLAGPPKEIKAEKTAQKTEKREDKPVPPADTAQGDKLPDPLKNPAEPGGMAHKPQADDEQGKLIDLTGKMGKLLDLPQDELLTEQYLSQSTAQFTMGKYKESIWYADKALELDAKLARAYVLRGRAKNMTNDRKGALEDCDKAIQLNPKLADAYAIRGAIQNTIQDFRKALADSDKALKLNPKLGNAYANRGYANYMLGSYRDAVADLEKALTNDTTYPDRVKGLLASAKLKAK